MPCHKPRLVNVKLIEGAQHTSVWPDSGSWPDWLAGIGTLATLGFLVYAHLREKERYDTELSRLVSDRSEQEIKRARRVTSNVVFAKAGIHYVDVEVTNGTDESVHGMEIRFVRASDGAELAPAIQSNGKPELAVMPPGARLRDRFTTDEPLPTGPYGVIVLEFELDGIRWRRSGSNTPQRLTPQDPLLKQRSDGPEPLDSATR